MTNTAHTALVEKMARAICKADGYDPEGTKFSSGSSAEKIPLDWEFYVAQAAAAISAVYEALREPSDEMFRAGHETLYEGTYDATMNFALGPTWQAMLSASPIVQEE